MGKRTDTGVPRTAASLDASIMKAAEVLSNLIEATASAKDELSELRSERKQLKQDIKDLKEIKDILGTIIHAGVVSEIRGELKEECDIAIDAFTEIADATCERLLKNIELVAKVAMFGKKKLNSDPGVTAVGEFITSYGKENK